MSHGGRFDRARGRFFSVRDERARMDRAMELQQEVFGTTILWYVFEHEGHGTVIDDIYDEGLVTGGKSYDSPLEVRVLGVNTAQGQETNDDQGLATYDHIRVVASYKTLRDAGVAIDLTANREGHLHDRIVWRRRVFDVEGIQTSGHFDPTNEDMTVLVTATQVRNDELFDSPVFQEYAT